MKKLIPLTVLSFLNIYSYSQDSNFYIAKPKGSIKTEIKSLTVTTQIETKSDYNNWESEILKYLTIDYIPNDLPLYKSTMTNYEYEALLKQWADKNPKLVKKQ